MKKQLYIRFVKEDVTSIITLFQEEAPITSNVIWQSLKKPIRSHTLHAIFAGPEIMFDLPESARTFDPKKIKVENQTCFPAAGDCLWFYQGKSAMKGLDFEMWEIGIFYSSGGRIFGPTGWVAVNIFGSITENLSGFAAQCEEIRYSGSKLIELGRYDD